MSVIWDQKSISKDNLQTTCDLIAKGLEKLEGWPYPEFSDKTKFKNFQEFLITEKYIKEDKDTELFSASKVTLNAQASYKAFFDDKFINQIQESYRHHI